MNAAKTILSASCQITRRDRNNQIRMATWTLAWSLAWVIATYGIKNDWFANDGLVIAIVAVVLIIGAGVFRAYRRYLRDADELLRKIELDALAAALGVGMIGGVGYWLLQLAEIVQYKDAFIVLFLLVCGVYSASILLGHRRFS